jgi:hypothetical protein
MIKRLNIIFYVLLASSFIVFLLPPQFKVAGYSLNPLGWVWVLVLVPGMFITFVWSSSLDLRDKNKKALTVRVLIFVTVLLVSVGYWYFQASRTESMGWI